MNFKTFLNESSIWENFIFPTRQLSRMYAGRRISPYIAQKQMFYVTSVINDRFLRPTQTERDYTTRRDFFVFKSKQNRQGKEICKICRPNSLNC